MDLLESAAQSAEALRGTQTAPETPGAAGAEDVPETDEVEELPEEEDQKTTLSYRLLTVLGIVIAAVFLPLLIMNCILILQYYLHPGEVPSVGGVTPLVSQTDSLSPDVQWDDLCFFRELDPEQVKTGDVVAYVAAVKQNGVTVATRRITGVSEKGGVFSFTVSGGVGSDGEEKTGSVEQDKVIGVLWKRIPKVGALVLFMQTPLGIVICVGIPVLLIVAADLIRSRVYEKRKRDETEELRAELERLRTELGKED